MPVQYFQKCPFCYSDAFEYKERPEKGKLLTPESVIHKGNPSPHDPIKCQNCNAELDTNHLTPMYLRIVNDV